MEAKDRENGREKEKERQRKPKTERMDERTRRNDSGSQRQREWTEIKRKKDSGNQRQGELTKERGGTTVEAKDRENGHR